MANGLTSDFYSICFFLQEIQCKSNNPKVHCKKLDVNKKSLSCKPASADGMSFIFKALQRFENREEKNDGIFQFQGPSFSFVTKSNKLSSSYPKYDCKGIFVLLVDLYTSHYIPNKLDFITLRLNHYYILQYFTVKSAYK